MEMVEAPKLLPDSIPEKCTLGISHEGGIGCWYDTWCGVDDGETKLELCVLEESVLQPICSWTTEAVFDDYIEFVMDKEGCYPIDVKDVIIHFLIPANALSFGSRQVGSGKGQGDPQGEESKLLYYIIWQEALEGLEVIVKTELEILW